MHFPQGVFVSLIQEFTPQTIGSENDSPGLEVEIAQNKNDSQEMLIETIDDKGILMNENPQTIPSKVVSEEMKEAIVGSREISNEAGVEKVPILVLDPITTQTIRTDQAKKPQQTIQESPQTEATTQSFKCNDTGRFAHPSSCEKYHFCFNKNEDHKVFNCPNHLAFDSVTQTCVHSFAVCASAPKCTHDKRIFPNPTDKSTYFECKFRHLSKHFVLRKRNCAAGREFDAELGYCKSKFLNDDLPSDSSNSLEDLECEQVGVFTDFSNDFGYFECVVKSVSNGTLKLIRHSCPAYHVFVATRKQCVRYMGW